MRLRFIAACVIAFSASVVRAQALADRVPEKVLLYVGWQGSESLGAGYQQSNLKGFLNDSNIPELVDEFLPRVLEKFGKGDAEAAAGMQLLSAIGGPVWRHPTAFFVADVEMKAGQPPTPHVALICDAGADADALKKELDAQVRKIPPGGPPVQVVRAAGLVTLSVGYGPGELKLPNPKSPDAKSLAADPTFLKALAIVGKGRAATLYVDVERLLATVDEAVTQFGPDEAKENWPKVREALGIGGLKRAIWTSGLDGKEWATNVFLAAPAPRTGLLSMLDGQPLSDPLLQSIPKNSTLAAAAHLNLAELVADVRTAVAKIDRNAAEQVDGGLRFVSEMLDLDVEKDLLASFGDEWAYYVDPAVAGRGTLGVTLVNRVHDAAKLDESLKKAQKSIQDFVTQQIHDKDVRFTFASTKVGDVEVNYLAIPLVTPSWAIKNGNLYVGLYPQVVATAAGRGAVKGDSILDNEAFAALRTRLGGEKASSFQFLDLPTTAIDSYGSWMAISHLDHFGDILGVPAPAMVLPPLNKLMARLSAAEQVSYSDADGFHLRAISPFPGAELLGSDPMAMMIPQQAMMVSILLPALNRAREQANRVKDASNLRQIGLAAMMYSNEKKGKFPDSLGELAKTQDITPQVFISPRTTTVAPPPGLRPDQAAAWVDEHADYVWAGKGKKNTAGADEILAYGKMESVTEGVNILYADGHVEFQMMEAAKELIEKSKKPEN